jgi:hypothetical protein
MKRQRPEISRPTPGQQGHFQIVSGTGAYAGLSGHGTFLIVVDPISNELTGTEEASANSGPIPIEP